VTICFISYAHAYHQTGGILSAGALSDSASIAFIGILETLISARMADEMHGETHHDRSREVFGLGIANIIGGSMFYDFIICHTFIVITI
jgi:Sulfate permease family